MYFIDIYCDHCDFHFTVITVNIFLLIFFQITVIYLLQLILLILICDMYISNLDLDYSTIIII